MAAGLNMKIIGYDLYPDKTLEERNPAFSYVDSIAEVLKNSDVVSLHIPAGEKPVINAESLATMKDGSYLINTARAALVDRDAMLEALKTGKNAGYAVDAFASEPSRADAHAQAPQGYPVLPYRRLHHRECGSGNSRCHPEHSGRTGIDQTPLSGRSRRKLL